MYRWSSGGIHHLDLVNKPISRWTVDDVTLWMEQLGSWTNQYREIFSREQVNGRSGRDPLPFISFPLFTSPW